MFKFSGPLPGCDRRVRPDGGPAVRAAECQGQWDADRPAPADRAVRVRPRLPGPQCAASESDVGPGFRLGP
jgi:hypothetical protein